jgi:hypothetical protein
MSRRKKLAVKSMHPMELYKSAMGGCDVSLTELIDRQQERKGLRLYPEGRSGPLDDGAVPVQLKATPTSVIARTGQPWNPIEMDAKCLSVWIIGMAECMEWLIKKVSSSQGLSNEETIERIDNLATPDFSAEFAWDDDRLLLNFLPEGLPKWRVPVSGAIDFVQTGIKAVEDLDWKIRGTKDQLEIVQRFADADCGDLWEIMS